MSKIRAFIHPDGTLECLYSDRLVNLLDENARIERASYVEPCPDRPTRWQADLSPRGGPVLRGEDNTGFTLREEALAAEVGWLLSHQLGSSQRS